MVKQKQKEAVYTAIRSVLGEHGITIDPGMNVSKVMTREHRAMVNAILLSGFKSGSIELDTQFTNDSELKAYISGLQSNWLRKDKRLNGNTKYVPKNQGVRAGSGDAQLKALRALLTTITNPVERADIQRHIDKRVADLATAKQKADIDFSALPASLQKKYSASA